jgi:hypothetical protein
LFGARNEGFVQVRSAKHAHSHAHDASIVSVGLQTHDFFICCNSPLHFFSGIVFVKKTEHFD